MKSFSRNQILAVVGAFLFGVFLLVALRFITYKDTSLHYHANFAVFVDNERLALDNFTFYEEVQSCSSDNAGNPRTRVHMHDQVNNIAHVHDSGATWGHFFANIGMTAGDTLFKTDKQTYVEGQNNVNIRYLLNDKEVQTIANRTIESEDTLLISIGNPTDKKLQEQYSQINSNAKEYNQKPDPSSCSGGQPEGFWPRLKQAFGFTS